MGGNQVDKLDPSVAKIMPLCGPTCKIEIPKLDPSPDKFFDLAVGGWVGGWVVGW